MECKNCNGTGLCVYPEVSGNPMTCKDCLGVGSVEGETPVVPEAAPEVTPEETPEEAPAEETFE